MKLRSLGGAIALLAFACMIFGLNISSAHANCTAPCTKTQIITDINANWPDNTGGAITPAVLRATVTNLVNSYLDVNGASTFTCPTHQFLLSIATLSSFTCGQPAFSDITGTLAASLVNYTPNGTGAVGTDVQTKLRSLNCTSSPQDFGAKGDNANDDTAALNLWLTYISTNHLVGCLPDGTYKITAALSAVVANNWGILGSGGNTAVINYSGASTTANIMVLGNGAGIITGVSLRNFRITSATTMSANSALLLQQVSYSYFDLVLDGSPGQSGSTGKLYNGVTFVGCQWITFNGNISGAGSPVTAYGGGSPYVNVAELNFERLTLVAPVGHGGDAFHFGGGVSGVYFGYVSASGWSFGVVVDNALDATHQNDQFFFSNRAVFDFSVNAGLLVSDTIATVATYNVQGWFASGGIGVQVSTCANCIFQFTGASVLANTSHGIFTNDGSSTFLFDAATLVKSNGGFGMVCNVANANVISDAQFLLNVSGDYSSTCSGQILRNAWTAYTPALTCAGTGTPPTTSAIAGRRKTVGKVTHLEITATLSSTGSCSAAGLNFSLGITAQSDAVLTGRENTTGPMIFGLIGAGGTTATMNKYDNSLLQTSGFQFVLSGSFENQ